MDSIEKKIREYYQERKQEDERSIPGFETFRLEPVKEAGIRKPLFTMRIAASVAAIIAVMSALIYFINNNSKPPAKKEIITGINMNNRFPSQPLSDQSLTVTYIWQWKAPTDKLLEDAQKSININSN
jgi:hypothetical protein